MLFKKEMPIKYEGNNKNKNSVSTNKTIEKARINSRCFRFAKPDNIKYSQCNVALFAN